MGRLKRLSDGELEIMQIIWHGETPAARTDIEEKLRKTKDLAPTTILTFLTRLCEKGYLSMERQGRVNLYTPLIAEREYLACESRQILDRLYGGSLSSFVTSLCDAGVDGEELEELRRLLREDAL